MMFSLVSIVIAIAFVSYTTPYVCTYIEENTSIAQTIEARCLEHIEKTAEDKVDQKAEETKQSDVKQKTIGEAGENEKNSLPENRDAIGMTGIQLPDNIWSDVVDSGADLANQALEESGVYETMASALAHFIITGIAFFASLIIILIVLRVIAGALDLFAKLPILKGLNRFCGLFAGLLKGLLIVWLIFYVVAITCTSSFGLLMLDQINHSVLLSFLYNNNLLLSVLLRMFG